MKYTLAAIALILFLFIPNVSAGAEDPTPDNYETNFANIIGIIGAGGADWYVSYPTDVPTTGTYHVAVTASTTAAATANIALTAGSFQGNGCTIGSFTSDTAATSQASGYFPVTVTAAHCFGSVRLAITSGSTTITAIRASFQIAADTVTVSDDANGWALTGIPTPPSALTISGELDIHQDPVTGELKICGQEGECGVIQTTTEFGNVTVNNEASNFRQLFTNWAPLIIALGILIVSAMRENVNYAGLAISGLLFVYCAVAAPFNDIAIRVLVASFGLYLIMLYAIEIKDFRHSKEKDSTEETE